MMYQSLDWVGLVWLGLGFWLGLVRFGLVWLGKARLGLAQTRSAEVGKNSDQNFLLNGEVIRNDGMTNFVA